jgi:tetratricopeptide (TPR) repeat protein
VVHANRALAFVALEEREHADEAADRVLAGFDSSDANELMAAYLARHAKAMALFGEARSHLHTSEKARRKAEKALKQLRELARDVDASPLASSAGMRKIRGLVWFAAAGTAYVLDKDDDAVGYCDNAIAAGAPSPAVWNLKGGVHLVLADYERARLAFGEVLASKADGEPRFEALSGVGRAHHHLGEYDVAVDYYRRALAEPCDDARTDSVVMQRLAEAYDELGRHPAALHAYRRAWARIKDRKRPARLVTGISAMLLRLNQPEEARAFIERERDAADHDRSIDFNLALAYARLDQRQRAIEIAEGIKDWKPAQQLLDALARTGGRDWIAHWFAKPGSGRSWAGALLLVVACLAFFAPPLFQLWREGTIGVEHALPLGAIALALFILPVAKSLSVEVPGLKLGVEPASRGDEDGKALERIMPASLTAALRSPALAAGSEAPTAASDRASLVQDAEDMVLSAVRVRVAIEREDSGEGAESAEARGRERAKRLRSKR